VIASISPRGPDALGYFKSSDSNFVIAHTRLSIVDLSSTGAQPMQSMSHRSVISYNGEIYNITEIRNILTENKIVLRGTSDTELILELIELKGFKEAVKLIKGMFAFAFFDKKANHLFLARDRFGEKPLYYGDVSSGFGFCSDLKPLMELNKGQNKIDQIAVGKFLQYNYIPAPYSIIQGISKLLPGQYVQVDLNKPFTPKNITKDFYWQLSDDQFNPARRKLSNLKSASHTFNEMFREVIADFMHADVKVGSLLSGGVDSSIIALVGSRDFDLNTYTLGFENNDYDEREYARKISKLVGSNHTEVLASDNDIFNAIPSMPSVYGEPFADVSQLPSYVISKYISNEVKVCLAGDGGDELFLGYPRYQLLSKLHRLPGARIFGSVLQMLPSELLSKLSFKLGRRVSRDNIESFQAALCAQDRQDIYEILFSYWKDLPTIMQNRDIHKGGLKNCVDLNVEDAEVGALLDLQNYLPDDLLVKMDRAAMANSLEVRLPFLDLRVLEFSRRLEPDMKWNRALGSKAVLKSVMLESLPKSFVTRKKQGFSVPLNGWINTLLADFVDEMLSYSALSKHNLFHTNEIHRILGLHREGRADYSKYIWGLVMFQQWYFEFQGLLSDE